MVPWPEMKGIPLRVVTIFLAILYRPCIEDSDTGARPPEVMKSRPAALEQRPSRAAGNPPGRAWNRVDDRPERSGRADHRGKQLPQAGRAGGALDRLSPTGLGDSLMRRDRFVRAGDHRDPGMRVWMRVRAERVHAQADTIAGAEDFERGGGFSPGE